MKSSELLVDLILHLVEVDPVWLIVVFEPSEEQVFVVVDEELQARRWANLGQLVDVVEVLVATQKQFAEEAVAIQPLAEELVGLAIAVVEFLLVEVVGGREVSFDHQEHADQIGVGEPEPIVVVEWDPVKFVVKELVLVVLAVMV